MPVRKPGLTGLTPRQLAFAKDLLAGLSATQAARRAGYSFPSAKGPQMLHNPRIKAFIEAEQKKFEKKADMTRGKIVAGLLEAIEIAKQVGEPASMVTAYRELGRLCGLYAPEKKQVDISVSGAVQVNQIENMSQEELLKIIEGEATTVEDDGDEDLVQLPRFPQPELPVEDVDYVESDGNSFA